MPVVAACPKHGAVNVERAFHMTNCTNVSLSGNQASCPAPGCTQMARVMDGVYNFDADGRATPITAPAWSRAALEAIQGPVQRISQAVQSDLTNRQVAEQIDAAVAELRARDEELPRLIADAVEAKIKGAKSRSRTRRIATRLSTLVADAAAAEALHQGIHSPQAQALLRFLTDTIA